MKHFNALFALATVCALPSTLSAQMEFYRASTFGSRFNDVNDSGLAISGGGYFDFPTLTWTDIEPEATSTDAINNAGDVAGSMYFDEPNFILQPAVRKNGVWIPIGWFPESNPQESSFTTYGISPNGTWVVGQMSIGCCDYGTFRYNTDTQVLTKIFDSNYVAVAGYCVTNDGTIGGWADDEAGGSTHRIPVYISPDLQITQVPPTPPVNLTNAVSAINASSVMVGDEDGHPFLFDQATNTFTTFDIPAGYTSATFTSISDNGIAVGYAQDFDDFGGLIREAIIYHPSLGAQPVLLKDILLDHGVDINAPTDRMGTAIAISPDGNYVAGWDDGAPFMAYGWVAYLDDLLMTTAVTELNPAAITLSPNPTTDKVNISAPEVIENVDVLNVNGQVVQRRALGTKTAVLDLSDLNPGVYTIRAVCKGTSLVKRVVKN